MSNQQTLRESRSTAAASAMLSGASARMLLPVQCPDCQLTNAADRKFCAGCGRGLWEPCLSCSTVNGAWEKFCGVCGGNLVTMVQERVNKYEAVLEQAAALQTLCRHSEAVIHLERVDPSDHPRLATYTKRCLDLARSLQAEVSRLELEREELFTRAHRCLEERRYEEAAAAMQRIHHRMRLPPMQKLLDRVLSILEELPALEKEIQDAVAERRTQGILPKVLRFLELKPNDPSMRELGDRLGNQQQRQLETRRNQLLNAAKQKIAEHEYALAARLVEQVDPAVRTPEVDKFLEYCRNRAMEVAWLMEDLRDVALFDEHLLPLAERLVKLRPSDETATKLAQRIARLHEQQAAAPAAKRRRCLPSKGQSHLGWPIELLEGFRHIDDEQIRDSETYAQNYSTFYVACGLALQGLNKAAMPLNLLPGQKKSLWGTLATSMLKKRSRAAWGINLGSYGLKAVKLTLEDDKENEKEKERKQPRVVAVACEYIPYSQPIVQQVASPESLVREALAEFCERHKVEDETLCVSYPAPRTLARFISLPPAEKKKLPDLVKYEARQQIPFALETVTWDYQVTWSSDGEGSLSEYEVGLFAVKSDEASQFLFPFEDLKLKVDLLQAENVALYNYLAFDCYPAFHEQLAGDEHSPREQVLAVLDIGATSSNLLIGNSHSLWVRNIPLGSQHFNKPLVSEFKLTQDQAEQLKRKPTLAAFASKAWHAMDPVLRDFQAELRRSLLSFEHNYRQRHIKQMLIIGGGIRQHALLRLLRQGPQEPRF